MHITNIDGLLFDGLVVSTIRFSGDTKLALVQILIVTEFNMIQASSAINSSHFPAIRYVPLQC